MMVSPKTNLFNYVNNKDISLGFPKLLIPSIQVNMRAGDLPPEEENGTSFIKIPVNKM